MYFSYTLPSKRFLWCCKPLLGRYSCIILKYDILCLLDPHYWALLLGSTIMKDNPIVLSFRVYFLRNLTYMYISKVFWSTLCLALNDFFCSGVSLAGMKVNSPLSMSAINLAPLHICYCTCDMRRPRWTFTCPTLHGMLVRFWYALFMICLKSKYFGLLLYLVDCLIGYFQHRNACTIFQILKSFSSVYQCW